MSKTTDSDAITRRRGPQPDGERPAVSYLVRFWLEPREQEGESGLFRGYARDLTSGEERYFEDPRMFAEHVLRRLHREDAGAEAEERKEAIG